MIQSALPTHIVGIGASAGGLAALEEFFKAMPEDSGMAFVLVQHLSPDFKSLMDDLLSHHTKMAIYRVENGVELQSNAIYLIPPHQITTLADGHLYLQNHAGQRPTLPIDVFFESLASDAQNRAIGIILSGTGPDGSRGIQSIHEAGGLVLAQSIESAQFDGMPRAAINTGICDYVTPPREMPALLLEYARNPEEIRNTETGLNVMWEEGEYAEIFAYLRRSCGLDFSKYKPTTVGRRIARRLGFHDLQKVSEYVQLLSTEPEELDALYHDLLIGVTEFFRDPAAYNHLAREVIPELYRESSPDGIRVWVAACATGEEAYSLAILLHEFAEKIEYTQKISIFATDVHRKSLDTASQGVYEEDQLQNVSPEHLARYFIHEGPGKYKVIPELRKMVIFAPQNLISDPPFTRIDLLSCRNLMIYFSTDTQEKSLATLNFALRTGGILFLGTSEGLGKLADEFSTLHPTYKIFRKQRDIRLKPGMLDARSTPALASWEPQRPPKNTTNIDRQLLHDYDQLLKRYLPTGVLLNEHYQVLHYFGDISQYLKAPEGRVETNFAQMIHGDLQLAVSIAMQRVASRKTAFTLPNIALQQGDKTQQVDVSVDCIPDEKTNSFHYLVTFIPVKPPDSLTPSEKPRAFLETIENSQTLQTHITELEQGLRLAQENLQAAVEELKTSNEELQAANEELLAANEELQSTNQELYTVNAEYEKKNAELQILNKDHSHLLASLEVGVVFLDRNLIIQKYNPASATAFKLLPQDIGRPINHIAFQLTNQAELLDNLQEVLQTGEPIETEIQAKNGTWLIQRVLPYLTDDEIVKGVILTFTDVTNIKNDEIRLRTLFEILPVGISILDKDRNVIQANAALEKAVSLKQSDLIQGAHNKRRYIRSDNTEMSPSEFVSARIIATQKPVYDVEVGIIKEDGTLAWTNVSGAPLPDGGMVIVAIDITERKKWEHELKRWKDVFENVAWGIVIGDPAGKSMQFMNPAFAAMHGYSEAELAEAPIPTVFAPEYRADLPEHIRIAHEKGRHAFESVHIRKDGTTFPVSIDIVAVKNDNGQIIYRIVGVQDITERKQAEKELRESEERFTALFQKSPTAMSLIRAADGVVIDINQTTEKLYGVTREEVIGRTVGEIGMAIDKEATLRLSDKAQMQGFIHNLDHKIRSKSGEEHNVLLNIEMVELDSQKYLISNAQDITDLKKAERELRQSEEKYRGLIESLDSVIVTVNVNGQFTYVNDEAARQLGGTVDTLTGKSMYDVFPKEYADRHMRAIHEVINKDQAMHFESQSFIQGKSRWYRTSIQPIHNESGQVELALVNATDIDDFKTIQEKLQELNQSLEARVQAATAEIQDLYNNAPAGYQSLNAEGKIIFVNETELAWLKYTREDVLGHSFADFILPQQVERFQSIHLATIQSGKPINNVEYTLVRQDGSTIPILLSSTPVISTDGNFVRSRSTLIDLTERKKAEEALRTALKRVNALYSIGQRAIVDTEIQALLKLVTEILVQTVSADRVFVMVMDVENKKIEYSCKGGPNTADIVSISFAEAWDGLSGWALREQKIAWSPAGTPDERESPLVQERRKATHAGDIIVAPLIYKNHPIGTVTVISDPNSKGFGPEDVDLLQAIANLLSVAVQRLRTDETLRQTNITLERALRLKDEFLANMSHELRTPLNAILGLSESLIGEVVGPINQKQNQYLNTINESGYHLLELINDILDLAKIEAGEFKLDITKINVRAACETSLRMIKELAKKKNQTVTLEMDTTNIYVMADERRFKQMVVNLLSNAVKFTATGGKLGLQIRTDPEQGRLLLTVWDTGIGIKEEDQARLFQPFIQLDSGLSRQSTGTGLGLVLVAEMARVHGGSIQLESKYGEGSRFTISLPWDAGRSTGKLKDSPTSAAPQSATAALTVNKTVLLVEDTEHVAMIINDYLEHIGYTVWIARDGFESVEKAKANPDIILMDVQMPGMDGLEATRRIRNEISQTVPIIGLTALAMPGDRERCMKAGMNDYMSKPVSLKELTERIRTMLEDSQKA